jgi:hypothetical protein
MQRSLAQLQQSSRTQQDPVHTFPHPTVVRHLPKVKEGMKGTVA